MRLFIRGNAVRFGVQSTSPWLVAEALVKKYNIPSKFADFMVSPQKVSNRPFGWTMKIFVAILDQVRLVLSGGDTGPRCDQHGTKLFCHLHPGPITSASNYGGQTTIRTRQILLGFYLSVQITSQCK
jgi:hypothetical protein